MTTGKPIKVESVSDADGNQVPAKDVTLGALKAEIEVRTGIPVHLQLYVLVNPENGSAVLDDNNAKLSDCGGVDLIFRDERQARLDNTRALLVHARATTGEGAAALITERAGVVVAILEEIAARLKAAHDHQTVRLDSARALLVQARATTGEGEIARLSATIGSACYNRVSVLQAGQCCHFTSHTSPATG